MISKIVFIGVLLVLSNGVNGCLGFTVVKTSTLKRIKNENTEPNEKYTELEAQNNSLKEKYTELKIQNNSLKEKYTELKIQNSSLEEKCKNLKTDYDMREIITDQIQRRWLDLLEENKALNLKIKKNCFNWKESEKNYSDEHFCGYSLYMEFKEGLKEDDTNTFFLEEVPNNCCQEVNHESSRPDFPSKDYEDTITSDLFSEFEYDPNDPDSN